MKFIPHYHLTCKSQFILNSEKIKSIESVETRVETDTKERLDYLKDKIELGRDVDLKGLSELPRLVQENFYNFKNEFRAPFDEEKLKSLSAYLVPRVTEIQTLSSDGQKLYRTDMFARVNKFLKTQIPETISPEQASQILLYSMEHLSLQPASVELALFEAMRMIEYSQSNHEILPGNIRKRFKGGLNRKKLAIHTTTREV